MKFNFFKGKQFKFFRGIQFKFLAAFISSIICASILIILFQQILCGLTGIGNSELARIEEDYAFAYFLVFLILTTLMFILFSRKIIKRIEDINLYVNKVKSGNINSYIEIKTKDEIGQLSHNISIMVKTLKDSIDKQKQSEKIRNEMISNISHDLRTPLTSLSGYIELIKLNINDTNACNDYIEVLDTKCKSLKNQVNDLLEYCNLNYKEIKIKKRIVSVKELIEQVIIDFIPQMEKEGISFVLEIQQEKLYIDVDINLFIRLLQNIISNGIFYGKSGKKIKVEVFLREAQVIIKIMNYGKPIPKEDITYIFERFYRGEKSRNENTGGKGMGLAVAKSIAELHNGSINVYSKELETAFEIVLPEYKNLE